MNISNVEEDDPYQIFNSFTSPTTKSVGSCISSVYLPPESVYYAAEYLRLQSEIDNLKAKTKNLETQLRQKDLESEQIQTKHLRAAESQFQEKFNGERIKIINFYKSRINSIHQKNIDLERRNNEYSKRIEALNEKLKCASTNYNKTTAENIALKAHLKAKVIEIKKLRFSESKLQKTVNNFLTQVLVQECETNSHIKKVCEKQAVKEKVSAKERKKVFAKKLNNSQIGFISSSLFDNSNETDNTQILTCDEQQMEEDSSIYQPISSPVTPVAVENHERISVITHGNNFTTNNSALQTSPTIPLSSLENENKKHYEVSCTLNNELDLLIYICSCGKKFETNQKLRLHLKQKNNGRVYSCRICIKSFLIHQRLKSHYETVHGIEYEFGKYGCGSCGQTFTAAKSLRQHQRTCEGK